MIIIDGVFFQINSTGIARVWQQLFKEWVKSGFADHILVLDRNNTAPKIAGINYYQIENYNYQKSAIDANNLQLICDKFKANIFISTYYTTPIKTPSVFLAHDMIPEVLEMDLTTVEWPEKHYSILHASKHISVSQNTAQDLHKYFPHIPVENITVAYPSVGEEFYPSKVEDIKKFKHKYNLTKPYFLFVGTRLGYKNATLLFRAFNEFPQNQDIAIVCVGGNEILESELADLIPQETTIHILKLNDDELRCAYSGAISLVYPSRYEGFGLPILEAMACKCPVITCRNSSIPEVAGEAVIYVSESDIEEMLNAFKKVQIVEIRDELIQAGFERIKQFSWTKMAQIIANILLEISLEYSSKKVTNNHFLWYKLREEQKTKQELYFLYHDTSQKLVNCQSEINDLQNKLASLSTFKGSLKNIITKVYKRLKI